MSTEIEVISPVDGQVVYRQAHTDPDHLAHIIQAAKNAQGAWRATPLAERKELVGRAIDELVAQKDAVARSITLQMGRPIAQSAGEVRGLEERARHMIAIAEQALVDVEPEAKAGFVRRLRREPLGTVLVLPPWNYPYLTAINSIVPALVAGNTVILKHSSQTPEVAAFLEQAFIAAGLPVGVFSVVYLDHARTLALVGHADIDFVAFTGSVNGGLQMQEAAKQRFIGLGLELGGKDPAYVAADADVASAVENLVDGSFFNSGQSCCGIERIYVHESLFDDFVQQFVALTKTYRFGNPLDETTNLGPMVRAGAADFVRAQIDEAVAQGAVAHLSADDFAHPSTGAYLAPQVLTHVTHEMRVMTEESFGPVVGIMAVGSDEEAIERMNDSDLGLTASIWTQDVARAEAMAEQIQTGTVFMNRCDYLDPALAWTGVKNTGRGVSLSVLGYAQLTRVKSYHFKTGAA